jgi:hypothetical protein
MSQILKFATEQEAMQHLANLTGKTIRIASEDMFMRGEPIEAMPQTLKNGILPFSKREENIPGHETHAPNRVAIGFGGIKSPKQNPALWKTFGGPGKVVYTIDDQVKHLNSFKQITELEFHVKKVPPQLITGVMVHNQDKDRFLSIAEENNIDLSTLNVTYL